MLILVLFFVERPADDFAHWLRCVYVGNVPGTEAVPVFAVPSQPRNFPMMM